MLNGCADRTNDIACQICRKHRIGNSTIFLTIILTVILAIILNGSNFSYFNSVVFLLENILINTRYAGLHNKNIMVFVTMQLLLTEYNTKVYDYEFK